MGRPPNFALCRRGGLLAPSRLRARVHLKRAKLLRQASTGRGAQARGDALEFGEGLGEAIGEGANMRNQPGKHFLVLDAGGSLLRNAD